MNPKISATAIADKAQETPLASAKNIAASARSIAENLSGDLSAGLDKISTEITKNNRKIRKAAKRQARKGQRRRPIVVAALATMVSAVGILVVRARVARVPGDTSFTSGTAPA